MDEKIRVLVDEPNALPMGEQPTVKAARASIESLIRSAGGRTIEIEAETLTAEVSAVYASVIRALSQLQACDNYKVEGVTFTLVIDASGGVSLLSAASGTTKAQVGLTFTVKPRSSAE